MYYANKTHFVIKIDKNKDLGKGFVCLIKSNSYSIFFGKYLKIPVTVLTRSNPQNVMRKNVICSKKDTNLLTRVNLTLIIFIFDVNIRVVVHARGLLSLHTCRRNPCHDLTDFFPSSQSSSILRKLLGNSLWVLVALRLKRE